jgi:hypothetical protein
MSMHLAFLASSSNSNPAVFVVFLLVFGVLMFVWGFRTFREYRIIEDTPLIAIRSVPMGLVHVSGKSTGSTPLTSPLTQVPCYCYSVTIERLEPKRGKDAGTEWTTISAEKAEVPFYLEDATGKILVNPQHAEYDVPYTFWGEVRPKGSPSFDQAPRKVDESLGVPAPTDEYLRTYLAVHLQAQAARLGQARPDAQASQASGAEPADKARGGFWGRVSVDGLSMDFGPHTYRLKELCLVPGRVCNVTGTCTENPAPADESDRNLIQQGENEKTFLITTATEKQLEKSLRGRALFLVLLGAAFIVGGVAIALHMAHVL